MTLFNLAVKGFSYILGVLFGLWLTNKFIGLGFLDYSIQALIISGFFGVSFVLVFQFLIFGFVYGFNNSIEKITESIFEGGLN